jgi:hypothetical protein
VRIARGIGRTLGCRDELVILEMLGEQLAQAGKLLGSVDFPRLPVAAFDAIGEVLIHG